jgi:hypothetical protein
MNRCVAERIAKGLMGRVSFEQARAICQYWNEIALETGFRFEVTHGPSSNHNDWEITPTRWGRGVKKGKK